MLLKQMELAGLWERGSQAGPLSCWRQCPPGPRPGCRWHVLCGTWPTLCDPMDCSRQAHLSTGLSRQEYAVGCHALLQGMFLTQGSKPRLLHWQADALLLSRRGSPEHLLSFWEPGFDVPGRAGPCGQPAVRPLAPGLRGLPVVGGRGASHVLSLCGSTGRLLGARAWSPLGLALCALWLAHAALYLPAVINHSSGGRP